ncbi:transglycosylase SLT domain-containing protein [Spongiibacter marinus]|uniref:transglycosylase SLT domain-containing protein n=1 Tax=Spongiibacter marinus TaxID=354246 RepID=UPI00195F9C51|nr:transglycosylase SLT domain-containing protein [Spongiibacter marinus]MBM7422756.1 soluble lytic murein transglycosylase [Spongiibacter marinus]
MINKTIGTRLFALLVSIGAASCWADNAQLNEQRQVYREAMDEISRGRSEQAERHLPALANYPLLPYVELELLKAQIGDVASGTIDYYLQQYRNTVVGSRIHIAWLHQLRRAGDWPQFIRYYRKKPISSLRCAYISALRHTGDNALADKETQKLWHTGHSLPTRCDGVLDQWLSRLAPQERHQQRRQRARLAIAAGQHNLAIYLLKNVPGSDDALALLKQPSLLYTRGFELSANDENRQLALLTLRRLAKSDFERANTLWHQLERELSFSSQQNYALRDAFARQIIASDAEYARDWINANDPAFEDPYLTEWRVRLALKDGDWEAVHHYIALLPAKLRQQPDWQYWWARADIEKNQRFTPEAETRLRAMATDRGYYSFMAADLLNQEYRLGHQRNLDPSLVSEVQQHSAILRARELYWHGATTTARLEWRQAMRSLNTAEQIAAAQLALDWQWSHQAIATAIQAGQWDDLSLRFPTPYQTVFARIAEKENIDLKWIYAIARQESAFASDARSPVGARGLMQLMPGTARTLARQMGRPVPRGKELLEPDTNIEMGGFYLGQLLKRFNGNRILATAAYNAGPSRVERVLMRQDSNMPADIWIENLPYGETREYIKNVMAFSVVYGKKLQLSKPILAQHERRISPFEELQTP